MMSGISGMNGMAGGMRPNPQQMFNRMDKDGSAGLDRDELNTMAEKVAERTGNEIDVDSLMDTYDGDGDGVLDEAETQDAMESLRDQMGPTPGEGPPPGQNPPPGGEMQDQGAPATYSKNGLTGRDMVSQLLETLSAAGEEEEEMTRQWIEALTSGNYTAIDTEV